MCYVVNMAIMWIRWSSDLSKSLEKPETNKQKDKPPNTKIQAESDMESCSKTRNYDRETGAWEVKTRDLWEWCIVSWVSGKLQEGLGDLLSEKGQSGSMNLCSVWQKI